jgi:hypothetical protein
MICEGPECRNLVNPDAFRPDEPMLCGYCRRFERIALTDQVTSQSRTFAEIFATKDRKADR